MNSFFVTSSGKKITHNNYLKWSVAEKGDDKTQEIIETHKLRTDKFNNMTPTHQEVEDAIASQLPLHLSEKSYQWYLINSDIESRDNVWECNSTNLSIKIPSTVWHPLETNPYRLDDENIFDNLNSEVNQSRKSILMVSYKYWVVLYRLSKEGIECSVLANESSYFNQDDDSRHVFNNPLKFFSIFPKGKSVPIVAKIHTRIHWSESSKIVLL